MGRRRYPPLTPSEVVSIVEALGFAFKRQVGSHAHYGRQVEGGNPVSFLVTVDMSIREFDDELIKSMIRQSGFGREMFYGATPKTKKKI